MADEPFLLKDLFDTEAVGVIAQAVHSAHPDFDPSRFIDDVFDAAWDDRALKARMRHIAGALRAQLPDDYRATLDILLRAAPHVAGLGFAAIVFSDFVEAYGTHDWDPSVPALAEFTKVVSAEFAIRPFLAADQERTIDQLLRWTQDPNPAVRRLASEGSRPRLPWGMRIPSLIEDPRPIVPILDALRSDPDETVRRSVANSVNDIAKDHPDVALTIVSGWAETPDEHFPALCNHALRTLVKAGNTRAMELLGYAPQSRGRRGTPSRRAGSDHHRRHGHPELRSPLRRGATRAGAGRLRDPLREGRRLNLADGVQAQGARPGARLICRAAATS